MKFEEISVRQHYHLCALEEHIKSQKKNKEKLHYKYVNVVILQDLMCSSQQRPQGTKLKLRPGSFPFFSVAYYFFKEWKQFQACFGRRKMPLLCYKVNKIIFFNFIKQFKLFTWYLSKCFVYQLRNKNLKNITLT